MYVLLPFAFITLIAFVGGFYFMYQDHKEKKKQVNLED